MKQIGPRPTKGTEGTVKLRPEGGEDLWHVYNLVRVGDTVTATTFRKVQRESSAGAESEKVKLKLGIHVDNIIFDPEGQEMRVSGKNLTENEWVKLGAHHTLTLEPHRPFQLHKAAWDHLDLDRIQEACDPAVSADLGVVLITEGLANVCLVGSSVTVVKAKVEGNIPKKRGAAAAGYDKALDRFLDKVLLATVRHVDWDVIKCLVIAGPGFSKDRFHEYLATEAVKRELKLFQTHKKDIMVAPTTSAFKHSVKELFNVPSLAAQIKDTKAAREVQVLQDFFNMMSSDSSRAFYGPGHVIAAHELGAIQTLLITDSLFRINNVALRAKYAALVEEVGKGGGDTVVFSGMHASGEQLDQMTGIAAILRFPLPDLEDAELMPDGMPAAGDAGEDGGS